MKTLILVLILIGSPLLIAKDLGTTATPDQIARWDLTVMPDGTGLPTGQGTAKQGEAVFNKNCQTCHGLAGSGGTADELAGIAIELDMNYPEKTVGNYWPYATTIFDLIRRSMPMHAPGSLSNDENYAVTAYLLYLNGIIEQDALVNADTLPKIEMPNRDGFIDVYAEEKKH